MFFEQHLLYCTKITNKNEKNILKMNKEVGMLLPKKELIQVEYKGKVMHSILSYPGTLGPASARNSDMPVTQNTHNVCLDIPHYR